MAKRMLLPDPCPSCKAVKLDDKMFSWHGTTSDGRPAGDVQFWIACAACGARFGRGVGGLLTTPEVAAEYGRQRMQEITARYRMVMDRRAREAVEMAATANSSQGAEPPAELPGDERL